MQPMATAAKQKIESWQEPPEIPEPYRLLRRKRDLGLSGWRAGGMVDQPAELMREWDVCVHAERTFERILKPAIHAEYSIKSQG